MTDPILIPCEGSGAKGHRTWMWWAATCPMCGISYTTDAERIMPEHDRDDLIARIARGDFDA